MTFSDGIEWIKAAEPRPEADDEAHEDIVRNIIRTVRTDGDAALNVYAERFDGVTGIPIEVSKVERKAALEALDPQTRADTAFAIANVRRFAEAQLATILPLEIEALPGVHLGHRIIPIETVGCYVPGGRYPLLSAPVMSIVPAVVAGCHDVIACLPPTAHSAMIAGCHLAGATRIFRVGGAQAIAAMAYGTQTVPPVHKIVGPGNAFVNEAKRQVFGRVGIDQLAGPSEIAVMADATGDAVMIAADLLAQAEHDPMTRVVLITNDEALARETLAEVRRQLTDLSTADVAGAAWRSPARSCSARTRRRWSRPPTPSPASICKSTPPIRWQCRSGLPIMDRSSSARRRASSIPTSAAAPTTHCRPWGPHVTPAVYGSAPTSRPAPING